MAAEQTRPAWADRAGLNLLATTFCSDTFTVPPLDNSLTPEGVLEYTCRHSPDHVWLKWVDDTGIVEKLTFKVAEILIAQAARKLAHALSYDLDMEGRPRAMQLGEPVVRSPPVVAMLANVDSQTYVIFFVACIRAGLVPFPIAINNSADGIEHLIRASGASLLLVAPRGTTHTIDSRIDKAMDHLAAQGDKVPATMCLPPWKVVSAIDLPCKPLPQAAPPADLDHLPVFILHSSGTTSFPKIIIFKEWEVLALMRSPLYSPNNDIGATAFGGNLPPWHAFGALGQICRPFAVGITVGLRTPRVPPAPIDSTVLLKEVDVLNVVALGALPMQYEAWAEESQAIELLRKWICTVSGGPLAPHVARKLIARGVRLAQSYGSTESAGTIAFGSSFSSADSISDDTSDRRSVEERLDNLLYMHFGTQIPVFFRPWSNRTNEFELLIGSTPWYRPNVINDEWDGQPVYATGDVFQRHPNRSAYKIVGRTDDQIMHSTGEKTNPGPLLEILRKHPLVKDVVYFGRQRPHVGALIEPAKGSEIDPDDKAALAHFLGQIEDVIREANEYAPTHSKLLKEMIIITSPDKPFQRTAKESVRTATVLEDYDDAIRGAYRAFAESSQTKVKLPEAWTAETVCAYIALVVQEALELGALQDCDVDLFSIGCDSLRAAKIRSVLGKTFATSSLPSNFIYANPTVSLLGKLCLALVSNANNSNLAHRAPRTEADNRIQTMDCILQKYSQDWPERLNQRAPSQHDRATNGEVVLVTGTTGSLGAHLLDFLVRDNEVAKVFAVNRRSDATTIKQRQQAALLDRGLSVELLESGKVVLVEADLSQDDLCISVEEYAQLRDETTLIIHNSWTLDFNLMLSSFEHHVRSTRHLLNLALRSRKAKAPRLIFTSSIATVQGWKAPEASGVPELPLTELSTALGTGYGESKAISEKLLENASKETGLQTCSVRIGQLSGTRSNGAWSKTDWLPMIVIASSILHCLPNYGSAQVSWLPTDIAAKALLDFGHLEVMPPVLHVVNPNTTSWDSVMGLIADTLSVPLVPFGDWVALLEEAQAQHTVEDLPALRLLDFYKAIAGRKTDTDHGAVEVRLSTDLAVAASETLRSAPKLGAEDVKKWLAYWSVNQSFL